jgi:PAS domain S-box-containing protein
LFDKILGLPQYSDSAQSDQIERLRTALRESRASEQQLRATVQLQQLAVEAAEVGTWTWDLQNGQLTWSERCKALFGLPPDQEVSYELFLACLHPDDRRRTDLAVQEAIRENKLYDDLYRATWPDESVHWLRAKGSLQCDEAGQPIRFQGIVIDFSAHKHAIEALEQQEQLFRTLANSIPQLAWMTDKTGWIFWYNQRWYDYTGTTFEDMQGWGWQSVHDPDFVDGVVARFTQALNTGEPWEDTFPLRGKDGQWRWFLSRALPIRDSADKIARWFGTNTDITEQLQTQADLRESEERLQAALDASATGTFRWNIRTDALQLGDNLKHLLGVEGDDAPRRLSELIAVIHPDGRDGVREGFEQCAKTGNPLKCEFQVLWPDGMRHWLLGKGQRFFDERNRIHYITGACVDVTDRKRWEEALRASEQHMRDVLNSVTTFVGVMRPDGRLIEVNSAALNTAGLRAEQVLGKPIWDAYWFQNLPAVQEQLQEATARARDGQSSRFDIEAQVGENSFMTVDLSLVPMFDANGKINYLIPSGTDVTERKRMTERLAVAKAEADSASQAKSEFLASMSHELRTPLNAIIGYSEMLQEEAEDLHAEKMVPDLERVRLAGKHLLSLINDVLDLSKIEAGKMEVYLEEFSIGEMLEAVAATARPLVEKNGNRFEVEMAPDLGSMRTDSTKLRQILLNLLSNAAKFTEAGAVRLEARRGEGTDMGQYLQFRVSDSGIGIAPEKLKQIFEPFTQAGRAVSQKFGGTGLGLALSRRFAYMMGGDIEVESELGKGSTFTVRVPIFFAPRRGSSAEAGKEESRSGVQVLVIDDDLNTRDLLARSLAREGYSSAVAASGDEGLRLARELRPQLIILDVLMPDMDGWSVLASLKADAELCAIPVVVVSMVEQQDTAYVLGAADYIVKPLSRDRLRRLIDRFCLSGQKHLLVVDDDPDMRNLLRQTLEKEGCYVVETEDGAAALESLKTQKPDLILLDLEMPRMDGLTFAHEIRTHEDWRTIPIVVITAKDLSAEERLKLKGYVQRIVEKGRYTRDELMAEIRKLLSRSLIAGHTI